MIKKKLYMVACRYTCMSRTSLLGFSFISYSFAALTPEISSCPNTQHDIPYLCARFYYPPTCMYVYSWVYYVMSIAASEETVDYSLQDKNDGTSLIDVISDSEQVASVIDDTGDHVLMLSFMNSSLNDQNSQRRYLF